jgi:hypothetical protein
VVAASAGSNGQRNEHGQSEEEIAVMMADQQHLCTGGGEWMTQQELKWQRLAAVDGAAAAAALTENDV